MKRFTYTAVDSQGQRVQGTAEADDWTAALATLTAGGWTDCRMLSTEELPALTAADAVELAGYLSELTRSGIPLDGTLKALAQDATSPALRRAIDDLSEKLAGGHSLDAALDTLGSRLPEHMRRLLVAAARSGRLSEALERLLAHRRQVDDMTARFRQAVAYPLVLLVLLLGWLLYVTWDILPQFRTLLVDDFQVEITWLLEYIHLLPPLLIGLVAAGAGALLVARLLGGAAGQSRLLAAVPVVGPCRAQRDLGDFAGLLAEFLDEKLPLDEALRLTAVGARDAAVQAACRASATRVNQGSMLSTALASEGVFPKTLVRWTEWGEGHAALPEALRSAASMFAERFELRLQLVRVLLPALVFGLIGASAIMVAGSIFQGLFRLITDLAGSAPVAGPEAEPAFLAVIAGACVLVFGTLLLVIAQVVRAQGSGADVTRAVLRYFGLVLVASAPLIGCVMLANVWGFVFWLLVVVAWVRGMIRYRHSQKQALWAALSLAADKQAPLAPMALAFADEQGGTFAVTARKLARQLAAGTGLSEAIAWCPRALPPEAALAARIGTDAGDLSGAVKASAGRRSGWLLISPSLLWLLMFVPVVIFVKLKIEPSLRRIFDDFDTRLPGVTMLVSQLLETEAFWWIAVAVALVTFVGWLQWRGTWQPRLPGLKKIARWTELAPVLKMLSLSTRHGRPLPQTLETIATWHPKRWVRRRVRAALGDLAGGASWQESLRRRRLLGTDDLAVLNAAERSGNLPWALAELGQSFARRADYRIKAWAEFGLPLMLMAVGLVVGLFVVAYFLPLVYLIVNLS